MFFDFFTVTRTMSSKGIGKVHALLVLDKEASPSHHHSLNISQLGMGDHLGRAPSRAP